MERVRPDGNAIDVSDPEAVRAWAVWLQIDEDQLRRLVALAGPSAGQIEYILGIKQRPRW